jgi:hypothetical protein
MDNADSTHHTDTTHFHYNYAGTGTLNNTNSLHSFLLNGALKLSMVKQSCENTLVTFGLTIQR